jgi:hypothetical protein
MPVPNGVDAAAQIVWGPAAIDTGLTPDPNGRTIYVWGYEYTTLLVYISSLGTDPFSTLGIVPYFHYEITNETEQVVEAEFDQTQFMISNTASIVGGSDAGFVPGADGFMSTRSFARTYERRNCTAPLSFRCALNNEGAHRLSLGLSVNRASAPSDCEVTVYAVRWSSGRSNI